MYIGKEAFIPAQNRQDAKTLFERSVQRIEVETHSYCNRRCDYCPNSVGDRLGENRRIPDDIWFLLLDNLREIGYSSYFVFTSYNEPLADRMILRRIQEARAAMPNARLMIYTNGDFLDADYLADLKTAGLDYLHVSIHTRPGGKYSEIEALNQIVKLSQRTGMKLRFQQLKPGEFVFARVPNSPLEIEIRAINYWRHGTDRGGLIDGFAARPARTLPCFFPFAHFHMGFEGTVVPCCHVRSDSESHRGYRYGNLRDFGSIFEIYASRIATDWRRHLISPEPKEEPCKTCSVAFLSQDPQVLARTRRVWETLVRDMPLPSVSGD